MTFSDPVNWINQELDGYMVNAEFSKENKEILSKLIEDILKTFKDAVFVMPQASLHITLFDWIAPLIDYDGKDKAKLFAEIQPTYDSVLADIANATKSITVRFNEIRVSPNTIFIVGTDNSEFQTIRDSFIDRVELLPYTKLPPRIIHSSLARFTKPIELEAVRAYIAEQSIDITQEVDNFRLVHSKREPLLEFEVLKRYKLR